MTSDLPPPGPEAASSDEPSPPRRRRSRPNYTARRVAVGSALLAVIAVAAIAVMVVSSGDDDQDVAIEPGWDTLVEIVRATGEVIVLDGDGDEIERLDGAGRVTDVHVRDDRLALVGADQVVLRGLDPDDEPVAIEIEPGASVVRHLSNRSFTLFVTPDVGGEIVVIDGTDGSVTRIGSRAGQNQPLLLAETLRTDRDATRFAVGDGRNFQTILVDVDPDVEPTFFPGVPMAVGDDLVVTSTNVGRSAELGFFDADGERRALVPTERPVAGVLDGARFVYVTEDGILLEASPTESEPTELADLGLRGIDRVSPAFDGRRLIVTGTRQIVVVDLDGVIVHESERAEGDETGVAEIRPWHTWRCLAIPGDVDADADTADVGLIIDLDAGETIADIPSGTIEAVTTDGCGVHVRTATGDAIATRSGRYDAGDAVRSIVLSPDGTAAIVVDGSGTAELITIDDSRRLDIGTRRGLLTFAQR